MYVDWEYYKIFYYVAKYQIALKKVSDICDKHPELKKLSSALRAIRYYVIIKPESSSATDLVKFTDQLIEVLTLDGEYLKEAKNWANGQ